MLSFTPAGARVGLAAADRRRRGPGRAPSCTPTARWKASAPPRRPTPIPTTLAKAPTAPCDATDTAEVVPRRRDVPADRRLRRVACTGHVRCAGRLVRMACHERLRRRPRRRRRSEPQQLGLGCDVHDGWRLLARSVRLDEGPDPSRPDRHPPEARGRDGGVAGVHSDRAPADHGGRPQRVEGPAHVDPPERLFGIVLADDVRRGRGRLSDDLGMATQRRGRTRSSTRVTALLVIRTTDFPQTSPNELSSGVAADPTRHAADQAALHAIFDSIQLSNPSASP